MKRAKILLLDFDSGTGLGRTLAGILECSQANLQLRHEFLQVDQLASSNINWSEALSAFHPDIILLVLYTNLHRPTSVLFQHLRREGPEIPILTAVEASKPDEMIELLELGPDDFVTPPLSEIDILPRIWRLLGKSCDADALTRRLKGKLGLKQLIGQSPAFLTEIKKIPMVAKCDANVLISGETGTGKELCARAIHYLSSRTGKPFIPVNCGAIPLELVENELFGHEKGAFTGASTRQLGLIQEADGSTLFLDEIDCLPVLAQVKLVRFLQEKEYRPLGSTKTSQADVRIIAAANINLEEAVRNGKLRLDLYYRLNIIPLMLPPLRERREDIPILARHFMAKYGAELNKQMTDFSSNAMQILVLYEWPGNVRELEHVVQRAVVLSTETIIRSSDLVLQRSKTTSPVESFKEVKTKVILQFERTYIEGLLLAFQGNITKAAQAAQKNRRAFWQLIRKHRIDVQSFRANLS